jgi:hypothetical protein
LTPSLFEAALIEDTAYQCPVCTRFDTYREEDHFYGPANISSGYKQ